MAASPTREELEAAHCWEAGDHVPHRPAMTEFRRRARLHQARWREAGGHPIGTQPMVPRPGGPEPRLVGSRLPLDYARATGATFLTATARTAATRRTSFVEREHSVDHQRLWADLLWSSGLSFNLFGELWADAGLADQAAHTWWPDAPGAVSEVRFAHSPGRLDPAFTGNLIDFDAAFVLDLGDGTEGIVALVTPYHDRLKREVPKPQRLARYLAVTGRSAAFGPEAIEAVNGTDLLVMWLQHLLLLSMLQHPSGRWRWGRFVVVHPAGNTDLTEGCARYRRVLVDDATFASTTLEGLLAAGALPEHVAAALGSRYLVA